MCLFLKRKTFWIPFLVSGALLGTFFAWELGYFGDLLPMLPRMEPTQTEMLFTAAMIFLLALDSGLIFYRIKQGTCPIGARRATTIAGGLGVVALLCPVCILLPVSLFGIGLSLALLAPFLPLLRVIVLFLLIVSTMMLWPKDGSSK